MVSYVVGFLVLAALGGHQRPAHPAVVRQFDELRCPGPQGALVFRLHRPTDTGDRPLPLVIWFHGRREAGEDNRSQLAWLELVFDSGGSPRSPAFVLAFQLKRVRGVWWGSELDPNSAFAQLDAILNQVLACYPIDRDRIYLAGISQGASACWGYALRHPGRFAAVLSMAAAIPDPRTIGRLSPMPIWVFQSVADGRERLRRVVQTAAAARRLGGIIEVCAVSSPTHDCWTHALRDVDAWMWLMDQKRGRSRRWLPWRILGRYRSDRQVQLVITLVTVAVAMAFIRWHRGRALYRWRRESQDQSDVD